MLEAVLANEVQQLLHPWDLNYARTSEGIQRVVSESALANVAAHFARGVIGRETGKTHRPRFDQSHAGAKRVLFANRARVNFLEVHLHRAAKMLRQIRAFEP